MTAGDVVAVALAAVFAWAGAAKLVNRPTTARSFRALGLPAVTALTTVVPVTELVLAAGLVLVPGVAAPLALAVLTGFTVHLVRARRAGVAVGCGCFGTSRRGPVSGRDLVRNAVLAAAAVAVAVDHGRAVAAAVLAAGGLAVALAVRPAWSTRVGRPAPPVPGLDYGASGRTVLAFVVASGCDRCDGARAAVAALGPGVQTRVIEDDPALFAAFGVRLPPVVVTVDRDGTIVDDGLAVGSG
jgi:hypothetical protein